MPLRVLSFLIGIVLLQQFTTLPATHWLIICFLVALFSASKRYWIIVSFLCGFLWANLFAINRLADRLAKQLESQPIVLTGYVIDLAEQDSHRAIFNFHPTASAAKLPTKIRLSWYDPTETIKAGQIWQFTVKLKRPHGMFNPAGFDYESWVWV